VWNDKFKTYESTVFGHPANAKSTKTISILGNWSKVDFGINFENDGLRVKAELERVQNKN